MKQVFITRQPSTNQGTFGTLTTDQSEDVFASGELPWKNDASMVSCIPVGIYTCSLTPNQRMMDLFGLTMFQILDVPGRTDCFIHPGNYCGDVSLGWKSDVEGCIILGLSQGYLMNQQQAVISSRPAIKEFMALMGTDDFQLTIA